MKEDSSPPINTQWLIDYALECGITLESIKAFLAPRCVTVSQWQTLPSNSYMALFNWVAEQLNEPQLGLKLGRQVDISSFGGGTLLAYHAHNLRDCWHCLAHYDQSICQGIAINFIDVAPDERLEYKLFQAWDVDIRHDNEMTIMMLLKFIRSHLGESWVPRRVDFTHPAPDDLSLHHQLIGEAVFFNQPVTAMYLHAEDLDTPISDADPRLLEELRRHVEELQGDGHRHDDVLERVRYFIARTIGSERCNAQAAADALFMSRRSLTRHLMAKGGSFRDIRSHIAMDMAKRALANTSSKVNDIALQLGYSECSAFDRAFKKLIGCSPKAYRQKARAD